MNRLLSVLPLAGLAAGAALAFGVMTSTTALAQSCQLDAGGGCLREGMKCSPPANGKCKTVRVGTRELRCECQAPKTPRPDRSERPDAGHPPTHEPPDEPREPPEPRG